MDVIICGAGQVGTNIARQLAQEKHSVVVIDRDASLIRRISEVLDVRGVTGQASHPDVLREAGAERADMIIAATVSDEVNMVACQVAHTLFQVRTKIARIREQSYLNPLYVDLFRSNHMPIDHIISPELEVAKAIARRLHAPGASEMIPLAQERVRVVGVRVGDDCPIINTPLRQLTALFPDLDITVLAISRNDRKFVPKPDDQMVPRDEVYFAVASEHLGRAMKAFGHEEPEAHRIIILGGGNIGLSLARLLEERGARTRTQLIEHDRERATAIVQLLERTSVLHGDALDPDLLEEARVKHADTAVAVTNDDETNILSALLAKRGGCRRTISLINRSSYASLINPLDIDVVVNPRSITVSTILQHVRLKTVRAVHTIGDGFGEVLDVHAFATSRLVNKPIRKLGLPNDSIIGAIVRDQQVLMPTPDDVIKPDDRVIFFAKENAAPKLNTLVGVGIDYFS